MELKGGLTKVNLSDLFADYGYHGRAEVFNLQIVNLSDTTIYFTARFRPINGIIEPGKAQQWQRININELYLSTREPVRFVVNFLYEREGGKGP
jgi:hypothetical protein